MLLAFTYPGFYYTCGYQLWMRISLVCRRGIGGVGVCGLDIYRRCWWGFEKAGVLIYLLLKFLPIKTSSPLHNPLVSSSFPFRSLPTYSTYAISSHSLFSTSFTPSISYSLFCTLIFTIDRTLTLHHFVSSALFTVYSRKEVQRIWFSDVGELLFLL